MDAVILILMALLAGVVLWLVLNQRHFQRVDYGTLVDQEERDRQLARRMEHLDRLIGDLIAYERERRAELDALVATTRTELSREVEQAKADIVREVLSQGQTYDELLMAQQGVAPGQSRPQQPPEQPAANANLVRFFKNPRQHRIAELLELGHTPAEVARFLGVSQHEVDLVGSIIFSESA
jgi:hypothetical protein